MKFSRRKQKKITTNEHRLTQIKLNNHLLKSKNHLRLSVVISGLIFFIIFCAILSHHAPAKVNAEDATSEIENAIFIRQEFFGSRAIVPLPTAQAQENLAKIAENSPDNPQVLEKLAELSEKLLRFAEAENNLKHLAEIDGSKLEDLAAYYEHRAQFEREAETLKKILFSTTLEKRAAVLERLIDTARKHDLKEYLQTAFYSEITKENANFYPIFERLIDNLNEEKNYAEALNLARQAKTQFPEKQSVLLVKEIEILLETNRAQEAEKVYTAAFDPFWTDLEAQKFYDFLNAQDRLRAYGAELKARFKKNPADFDAGIRLALYQNHDYSYGNDAIAPTILKLEKAKKNWTTEELVTVSRLLIQLGEADLASRFLYTLYLREDFKTNSELRAKILYQLFEMFSDAENRRLPLTRGDLSFYEDVARADTSPGIATGILSLIFSDSSPREKLDAQEIKANKLFNRAAAYRIFEEYKQENPASTELAQMYLDIVRLYTATKDTEIAEKTLNEFAEKYENSQDYPAAALKLADAFIAVKNQEKAREVYQKALDYLGKQGTPLAPKKSEDIVFSTQMRDDENFNNTLNRNDGINIPNEEEKPKIGDYYDEKPAEFQDYLGRKNDAVTYQEVLGKYIASFAGEKKTADILALYSNEIAKYPNEEWLYEQRLTWLEQTNLTAEQLDAYKTALARFQTNNWRDKFARFFLRNNRQNEFTEFSEDLISKLNDADTHAFLSEFVDGKVSATDFEKQLYLKLYLSAHRRFPHNVSFVNGLLRFYKANEQENEWRKLSAEYYFESPEVRNEFLDDLAKKNQLRNYLDQSKQSNSTIYELFRADASARLSDFENAVPAYRKLNRIYPNALEFSTRLINFTRSFGQKNSELLSESADLATVQADFLPNSAENRTQSGEIYAESGDYDKAHGQWEKLIETAHGDKEIYLDTATVYWDYFQYDDALQTIKILREKFGDDTLYAFETGAILEAESKKDDAIKEYVKALDANRDETQKEKAIKRLTTLYARERRATDENKSPNNQFENVVAFAFSHESAKRKDSSFLSLGYADFLKKIKQNDKAEAVLNQSISLSKDKEFLEAAKDFYQSENNTGEQFALRRLADTAKNPREIIAHRLQLAESFAENQKRDSTKIILDALARQFPTNYGVLTEASDFYNRLGFESESARILENALPKSRGAYRNALAQKLAKRLIQINQLDSAERVLTNLHDEDKSNIEIFDELARVYVRTNKPDSMRKAFAETVSELKKSDADRRETEDQIADLRTEMIDAFTRLKDYKSAVEQHIEIINREPENEDLTDKAIDYVKRYGGAETLVNYYEKTSAEAFKNYRWNVVLARIYEANNDSEKAIKNYRSAIDNQPEMPDLYLAIANLETKRGNYDEALKNIDEVLEISGDQIEYVKKKIEILKKAGKFSEIEAEKAKLPAEENKKIAVDQFAEARKLQANESEKAREIYRAAFAKLLDEPLSDELKTADIAGYVKSIREEEPLDKISEQFWTLREKLIAIADQDNSTNAGEAKRRLAILDSALTESIGSTAKTFSTDEELKNLHDVLSQKIEGFSHLFDPHQTVSLIQDLSRRAGFGDLEEKILLEKVKANKSIIDEQIHLSNLVNFYNERGAYQKTFDVLEKYGSDNLPLKANAAKLVGNREKELEALRAIYWKTGDKISLPDNENVARLLEILYAENKEELKSLTEKNSAYQLQLINFLLGKGETKLSHAAIESSNFAAAWKVSRHAETSLALREFDEKSECFFCDALQFDSIGEMVKQTPDKKRFLINDDWFRLTREYGEWLFERKDKEIPPAKFLAAMIENQPHNANEQFKLGEFYFERGELKRAIEHLRLAVETDDSFTSDQNTKLATLGAAYFKIGRKDYAEELWARILEDETVQSGASIFQVLHKYGLDKQARENLSPIIVKFLQTNDAENSEDFQKLIRAVAASFANEQEKPAYFQAILQKRATDTSLAAMLVNENLVSKNQQKSFYELLINRNSNIDDYDYNFTSVAQRVWAKDDAESIYEQENDYKTEEPQNDKYDWQKKYLELLVNQQDNVAAFKTVAQIEKELDGRYVRPAWLREAKIKLEIRAGKLDELEIKRFVGIAVGESATEITLPSVERFNDVLQILKEENRAVDSVQLSENFFARMLALNQYSATNVAGLSRAFFQNNKPEKAIQLLSLMTKAPDENERETALSEIAAIDEVTAQAADATKNTAEEEVSINILDSLKIAGETALEFGQPDSAIKFRRQLLEANPTDSLNKIELAKILVSGDEKQEAENLLTQVINDQNSPRASRWQARLILNAEIPNANFDSFSQFYNGLVNEKSNQNEAAIEFCINSLIADKDAEIFARQELIKLYLLTDKPFAAIRLAETDKTAKSDELLEILSIAAERNTDFGKAIEFENAKSAVNAERLSVLKKLSTEKNIQATDFKVDLENTRNL